MLPIRRQTESALKRIESTLNAAGTSLANCLKAQVHIAGEENFPDFLDVWNEHVGTSPAALTVTPAKGFASLEMIVEINCILLKDGAQRKKEIVRADIPEMASYSPAVRAGEFVFSPGLLPLGRDGTVAGLAQGDNFQGLCLRSQLQASTIYDHAEAIAKAAGTSMRNVVRIDYWVSDIREFPGVDAGLGGALRQRAASLRLRGHAQAAGSRRHRDGGFLVPRGLTGPGRQCVRGIFRPGTQARNREARADFA